MALYDCHSSSFWVESPGDYPEWDCFPLHKSLCCCWWNHDGHAVGVLVVVFWLTGVDHRLSCWQFEESTPIPSAFTDSQYFNAICLHFVGDLDSFTSFIHGADIPCPHLYLFLCRWEIHWTVSARWSFCSSISSQGGVASLTFEKGLFTWNKLQGSKCLGCSL